MADHAVNQERLAATARSLVAEVGTRTPGLLAAYSDGSFARGDMVRGSDVDIAFVVRSDPGPWLVHRRIVDDVLFEWALIAMTAYADLEQVLSNAGFTHDIACARIWHDPERFFEGVQGRVRSACGDPRSVRLRAGNQLRLMTDAAERFEQALDAGDRGAALAKLVPILRHGFAVPSAVLNRPLTNCRGPLYCRDASRDLHRSGYADLLLEILGSTGCTPDRVRCLLTTAAMSFERSGLSDEEVRAYRKHLEIADYLAEVGESGAAAWPIFFWVRGAMWEKANRGEGKIARRIEEAAEPVLRELRLSSIGDLSRRLARIKEALAAAGELVGTSST